MQARPVYVISMEASEIESAIMAQPVPIYPQAESSSLSHTETTYVYSDGTGVCIAAFVQDSMLPEHTSVGTTGLSSTKSVVEAGSLTSMEVLTQAFKIF